METNSITNSTENSLLNYVYAQSFFPNSGMLQTFMKPPDHILFTAHVQVNKICALKHSEGPNSYKGIDKELTKSENRQNLIDAKIDRSSYQKAFSKKGGTQRIHDNLDLDTQKQILEAQAKSLHDSSWGKVYGIPISMFEAKDRPMNIGIQYWRRNLLEKWLIRSPSDPAGDPVMLKITHFHRLGPQLQFEFLCTFQCMLNPNEKRAYWMPYVIFVTNSSYAQLLTGTYNWDTRSNEKVHFEKYEESTGFTVRGTAPDHPAAFAAIMEKENVDLSLSGVFSDDIFVENQRSSKKGVQTYWPKNLPDVPHYSEYKIKKISELSDVMNTSSSLSLTRKNIATSYRVPPSLKSLARMVQNATTPQFVVISDCQNDSICFHRLQSHYFDKSQPELQKAIIKMLKGKISKNIPGKPGPLQELIKLMAMRGVLMKHYTLCADGRDWVYPTQAAKYGEWFDPKLREVRGSFMRAYCCNPKCNERQDADLMLSLLRNEEYSQCKQCPNEMIRPEIYLDDERHSLSYIQEAQDVAELCTLMIIVGDNARDDPWMHKNMRTYRENSIWIRSQTTKDPAVMLDRPFEGNVNTTLKKLIQLINTQMIDDE